MMIVSCRQPDLCVHPTLWEPLISILLSVPWVFGLVILSESISSDIFKSIWNKGILRANLLSYDHFCVARYKLKSRSFTIYLFGRHGKETGCAIYISKCKSNLISLPPLHIGIVFHVSYISISLAPDLVNVGFYYFQTVG